MEVKVEPYVYFALKGDDFDPSIITERLGIKPSDSWKKGFKRKPNAKELKFSFWSFSTVPGEGNIFIGELVNKIINELEDKIDEIIKLKEEFNLYSVLEVVLEIDTNPEMSSPALSFDLRVINFLYKTQTDIDVDIYKL